MTVAPGTLARARQTWIKLRAQVAGDGALRVDDVVATPVLLRPGVLEELVDLEPQAQDDLGHRVADALTDLRDRLSAPDGTAYPLGAGPMERLWGQLDSAAMSPSAAFAAAAALPMTEGLTPAYVRALLRWCAQPNQSNWRASRTRAQLILRAVDACPPEDAELREAVDRGFPQCARTLLCAVPDRRLLEQADAGARRALAKVPATSVDAANLHFDLAALWGDPYTADRSSEGWQLQNDLWNRRGFAELSQQDGRPTEDWRMPDVGEALPTALTHWRAAYAVVADPLVVAGWAEAALLLAELTKKPVDADVGTAIHEALAQPAHEQADGAPDLGLRLRLLTAADRMGADLKDLDLGTEGLDVVDLDAVVARDGVPAARLAWGYAQLLADRDPAAAVRLLEHFVPVFASPEHAQDADVTSAARTLARALHRAAGLPPLPDRVPGQSFTDYATEQLQTELGKHDDEAVGIGAVLALRLALNSVNDDSEAIGLQLLSGIQRTAPLFGESNRWAIDALAATLHLGEGVNRHNAGDDAGALVMYSRALQLFTQLGRRESAGDVLDRIADIAAVGDVDAVIDVVGRLVGFAPEVLARLGPSADRTIGRVMSGALGALLREETVNLEVLWAVLQFGTGLRTALELNSPAGADPLADPIVGPLLGQLADEGGAGRPDAAAVLRSAAESRLRELVLAGAKAPTLLDTDALRGALDDKTVVLTTATVLGPDGHAGRLALLLWDDGQAPLFTGWIPPGEQVPILPASLGEQLEQLADQGKSHLCVYADRGLSVVPWHLLDFYESGPLGDRWVVSVLPHPHVLLQGRRGAWVASAPDIPVVAFGVADAGPDWDHLDDAPEEAAAVAGALGGLAVPEDQATETTFRRLAPRCQYLHIATHGVFDPDHPAFHAVILRSDFDDDGVLQAWEVARLDLSGVRLVTLSACDTARLAGRDGGSVDGLPLAFLAAGARAVIGTQIEIETGQARFFFERLYQHLAQSPDVREAFRAARDASRAQFPDSAAWGSFYLLGDWR